MITSIVAKSYDKEFILWDLFLVGMLFSERKTAFETHFKHIAKRLSYTVSFT